MSSTPTLTCHHRLAVLQLVRPSCGSGLLAIRCTHDDYLDDVSADVLLRAEGVVETDRARSVLAPDTERGGLDRAAGDFCRE